MNSLSKTVLGKKINLPLPTAKVKTTQDAEAFGKTQRYI